MREVRTKQAWRREIAARRQARGDAERAAAADSLAERVLGLPGLAAARTVAAYTSFPSEPGTGPLRAALRHRGVRVLLPVLLADRDLDWVPDRGLAEPGAAEPGAGSRYATGPGAETPGAGEPEVVRLGLDAVAAADVVVCPAVAVDAAGTRLGRGGGSYDRVLARLGSDVLVVALLHDDEVVGTDVLPREPHDRRVGVVVTPTRTLQLREVP